MRLLRNFGIALGLAMGVVGFGFVNSAQSFIGCFDLSYQEWGPSRAIGDPIGNVPAPSFLKLTQDPVPDSLRMFAPQGTLSGRWLTSSPRRNRLPHLFWRPVGSDSAIINVPYGMGLFGITLKVGSTRAGFRGVARTYTDDVSAEQATSQVAGTRTKCRGA